MPMKRLIALIAGIILPAVVITAWFFISSRKTASETADWNLCLNYAYGYEIKYPAEFRLDELRPGDTYPKAERIYNCNNLSAVVFYPEENPSEMMTIIAYEENDPRLQGAQNLNEYFKNSPPFSDMNGLKERKIGGVKFMGKANKLFGFYENRLYELTFANSEVIDVMLKTLDFK